MKNIKRNIISAFFVLCGCMSFAQIPTIGEIRVFAGNFAPAGWAMCDGSLLPISEYETLFSLIGTTYGGDGLSTFATPNLNQKVAINAGQGAGLSSYTIGQTGGQENITLTTANLPQHTHSVGLPANQNNGNADNPDTGIPSAASSNAYATTSNASMAAGNLTVSNLASTGSSTPISNMQPTLAMNYIICLDGLYNGFDGEQYLGEIKMLAYNGNLPPYCLPCDGRLLPINSNQALFSLLGTTYGGNGMVNFALPDLRSRIPLGQGTGSGGEYTTGQTGGTETEQLTISQMPAHSHTGTATTKVFSGIGNANTPENNYPAINPQRGNEFSTNSDASSVSLGNSSATGTASPAPINNVQPYCTIQYVITTQGIFPSQY